MPSPLGRARGHIVPGLGDRHANFSVDRVPIILRVVPTERLNE